MFDFLAGPSYQVGDISYRDGRRYIWLLSIGWPALPILGIYLADLTGWDFYYWITPVFFYGFTFLLDHVVGTDPNNPPEEVVPLLEADVYYRYLTYAMVPVHFLVFLASAWWIGTQDLSWLGFLGLTASVGLIGGLAINTGHELGHKRTGLERWLSKIVLSVIAYGHFFVEHNRGHHHDVATPEDPASARLGENIYKFARREMPGAWRRAWDLEAERLARLGKSPWCWDNDILQPLAITVVLYGALLAAFGPIMIPFLFIQGLIGWFQLTSANYVEHYGLLRAKGADGRFERPLPRHSWNSNRTPSNMVLLQLQRHSDHHAWPTRRYQSLRAFDEAPELPSGYPGMFLAAWAPPIWHRVMDPRVLEWAGGDITKANIDPDQREAILARYPQPAAT
jgi:alkane 1-monooxygenase